MIRRADIQDIDLLVGLFHAYRLFYQKSHQEQEEFAYLKERLTQKDSLIYLVYPGEQPDKPVGFTQVYHAFSSVLLGRILILNDLYVDENFRSRGLGEELILAVIRYMKETGSSKVILQTNRDNFVAQRLYQRLGFKKESRSYFYEYINL